MEFYEGPDGIGRAVQKSVHLGQTYVDLVGEGFRGTYPLITLSLLEDHSEELLSRLPAQGVNLPYDPSPRYMNPGEATIEPNHNLPANLNTTNSVENISHPDQNIMDVFPTDSHHLFTPYHRSSYTAALDSLFADAEVNPQEHNDALQDIEYRDEYSGEDQPTHTPFTDDPFLDGHFDNEMSDPTTEDWGTPAVQQFPAHGASTDFRGGRPAPRLHFEREAELPDWMKDKVDSGEKEVPQWIKERVKINPEDYNTHDWEGAIDPDTGERINHGPGIPFHPHGSLEGDNSEEGEFVEPSEDEGTFSDHEAAWENQSPKWDELPSSSTLDGPFSTNNWDDRTMAPGNSQSNTDAQVDPVGAGDSGGTEGGENHDDSQDGPYEDIDKKSSFDFLSTSVQANQYIKERSGGGWGIIKKDTGDFLPGHYKSKEDAQKGFEAIEVGKHGGVQQSPAGFFYVGPGGHQEGPFPTAAAAEIAEQNAKTMEGSEKQVAASYEEEEIPQAWRQYFAFIDKDAEAREAAWADVRAKGQRLAREGHVHVNQYTSFQTNAKVQGDEGVYQVTIYRSAGWSKGVAHYTCNCEWGKWAWRRHFYYGRFCSHGYATYLENQKLDARRRNGPLESLPVGLMATSNYDEYTNGDQVRVTSPCTVSEVDGGHSVSLVPGDTGEIISIPDDDYCEVRLHSGDSGDDDVKVQFEKLEKIGSVVYALETHDESENNDEWGSEAFEAPYVPDDGGGSQPDFAKDQLNPGTDDVTASVTASGVDPDQYDPQHDKDIKLFSDDLDGVEVPHIPESDRLRSVTKFDDPHFADATGDDESDDPTQDAPEISSPETSAGSTDNGTIDEEDSTTAAMRQANLSWLNEENSSSDMSGGGLVDPILAAKLMGSQQKMTKSSAKVYTPMEQFALVEEEGSSPLVDHLNLANSFYENR